MGSALKNNPLTSGIETDYELNIRSAKQTEADSQYRAGQRRKAAEILQGEQVAAIANSGIELSGSAAGVVQSDQIIAELEAMNEIYAGKFQAATMKKQAKNQKKQAYLGLATQAAMFGHSQGMFKGAAAAGALNSSGGGSATLNEVNQSKTSAKNYSGSSNRNLS